MSRNTLPFWSSLVVLFAFTGVACGAPSADATSENNAADSIPGTSGLAECPGLGWTNSITSWNQVSGTFLRLGLAPAGAYTTLTLMTDPVQGVASYERTVNGLPDTGVVALATDNPALGPAIEFRSADLQSIKELDWVLGQQRDVTGRIVGICLHGAVGPNNQDISDGPVFMMTRIGF
jgi:hypothetical protein